MVNGWPRFVVPVPLTQAEMHVLNLGCGSQSDDHECLNIMTIMLSTSKAPYYMF